jgi:hypothetical protein
MGFKSSLLDNCMSNCNTITNNIYSLIAPNILGDWLAKETFNVSGISIF